MRSILKTLFLILILFGLLLLVLTPNPQFRVFLAVGVALGILIIFRLAVTMQLKQAAEWFAGIRRGERAPKLDSKEKALLGPLAKEATRIGKSLEMARNMADKESKLRQSNLSNVWTPERLRSWVKQQLGDKPIFVASNREPYVHTRKNSSDGSIECLKPASGLVTAVEPVLKACGGTWVAQAMGDADRESADENGRLSVPPENPAYTLRRVWISEEEEKGFYFGFSNQGLWPLCHIAHTRPVFLPSDYEHYHRVNQAFADVLLSEMKDTPNPLVLVQDYHFALLPRMIKAKRPDAKVCLFWHIPWPNPEVFGICPWRGELLDGMLGADIIGFHVQFHCNNFIESVDRFLESRIDYENYVVHRSGISTQVKPYPISIAYTGEPLSEDEEPEPAGDDRKSFLKDFGVEAEYIGVGVDRLDYTKGILERFQSIEYFLDQNSEYVGKFTFVELGAPSRGEIPQYANFSQAIEDEAKRINDKFKTEKWTPILFLKKHQPRKFINGLYRRAEVCMVTSLHDGMNLVCKEFVAARTNETGVLILSQFTGAAREFTDALIINPYDIQQMAEAIKLAIQMPESEQIIRMKRMRETLKEHNIFRWAADMVGDLFRVRNSADTSDFS